MKMDIGLQDSNCMAVKTYEQGAASVVWTRDTTWKTERHSGIISSNLIANGIVAKMRILYDEVDYFRFPFCTLPGVTPLLLD